MEELNRKISIIAYYLSEYDIRAIMELGYKTQSTAVKDISAIMGKNNSYLKLRRDEFDVLTSSHRKGFRNRPVTNDVQILYDQLSVLTYEQITEKVKQILYDARTMANDELKADLQEQEYITSVNRTIGRNCGKKHIAVSPVPVKAYKEATARQITPRDPEIAANALCNADYKCECNGLHKTFIRKSNGKPYTEPHHLVPMKYQKDFNVSLDVENNIVSLCSNCHNFLHYGMGTDEVLKLLYEKRKEALKMVGIIISYDELKELY